ncbi:MAG TPA: hypothetical protein VFU21_27495 [Kofleriaceae bacterium]|nr:hypothetical protein [Kofleriaceae bacterium]
MSYPLGIAGLLAASAFFGAAAAPGEGGPELPDGWRELPELVLGARPGQVRVESRRAWGNPANGCFALVQRVSGERAREGAARAALVSGLKARGLEVSGEGDELSVAGAGVQGRIRTALRQEAGGRFAAVSAACFYNGRQPDRCKPQCDALLDRLGGG